MLTGAHAQTAPEAPSRPARNWDQPLGPTIADAQSPYYAFETFKLDSGDGERHYKVYVGVPKRAAPATGYPVIYMLDGNAVMATLRPEDLAALDQAGPPVLVGIGYDVDARHDVIARAYDYTPPARVAPAEPVIERGRRGGGAEIFLQLLERSIRPAVERHVAIDPTRQTLWGHSYGGLFTLYTLLTRPESFQRYVAGDPSVGWQNSTVLTYAQGFSASDAPSATVRVMVGGASRRGPAPGQAAAPASVPTIPGVPNGRESTYAFVKRLADEGMDITFQNFPEQNHGQLFATSLRPALELASQP